MQTHLNKISKYFERIMQIADYYGYKNPNDFAKNALNYSSPEKINRLKNENNKPSIDILIDISNKFEEISMDWLLKGNGKMIKDDSLSLQKNDTVKKDDLNKSALEMIRDLSAENALLKDKLKRIKAKDYGNLAAEP